MGTTALVVYCLSCDYFLKIAVSGDIGTHGCAQCGSPMEVYVALGTELRDHWHRPPAANFIEQHLAAEGYGHERSR